MSQRPIFNSAREYYEYEHEKWRAAGGPSSGLREPQLSDWDRPMGETVLSTAPPSSTAPAPSATTPMADMRGVPNRGTSESQLDQWNRAMRSSDVYQTFMQRNGLATDGRVKLSRSQQAALERELARAGFSVPGGMHIDQGGNLNQKNRTGRNLAIGAAVTGAALTGFGLAGMGPLSGLAGGGTVGGSAAAAGSSAAGGGAAASGVGTTAGYGSLFGGNGAFLGGTGAAGGAAAGAGGSLAPVVAGGGAAAGGGGLFRMSDLTRYGIPAVAGIATSAMGNRASTNASNAALDVQQRQFDATQAWLREQEANTERRHREIEDEKRRQFDAVEAEKRRRYGDLQPFRDASKNALTRMSDMIDRGPNRVAYQPTFQYRP